MPGNNSEPSEAEECAALAMLHSLQTRHMALFNGNQRGDVHGLSNEDSYKGLGHMQTLGHVDLLHPGYGELRPIPLGHRVKVRSRYLRGHNLLRGKWGKQPLDSAPSSTGLNDGESMAKIFGDDVEVERGESFD